MAFNDVGDNTLLDRAEKTEAALTLSKI